MKSETFQVFCEACIAGLSAVLGGTGFESGGEPIPWPLIAARRPLPVNIAGSQLALM